jgi:hypothetical protein
MQVFAIAPSMSRAPWWLVLPLVGLVIAFIAIVLTMFGSRTARFEVSNDGVRLRGDMYGRLIPAAALIAADVRRVDFTASPGLRPRRRMMGTGLPGYQAGWYRLDNGDRALLYLTDRSRAVYVPTRAGYSLLLTPSDPDAFVAAVRALGGRP